jgi:hypothetical protein
MQGDLYFADPDILDEVARNDPELLQSAGPENLGFRLTKFERRERLSQYTLHLSDSGLDSVEILARIVEYAAVFHNDNGLWIRPFVNDVSAVLVGINRSDDAHVIRADAFDQSGLLRWFQDTSGIGRALHAWDKRM